MYKDAPTNQLSYFQISGIAFNFITCLSISIKSNGFQAFTGSRTLSGTVLGVESMVIGEAIVPTGYDVCFWTI